MSVKAKISGPRVNKSTKKISRRARKASTINVVYCFYCKEIGSIEIETMQCKIDPLATSYLSNDL
ncbi:MAG: hypothetical protein NZ895_04965 [Archaeoglobaceae archaeon]|nr:hypothetical protein [Archaeoglobaceae archaeon]MCX8152735.1 hypothetical protein [Archaeoglobaceae archaeon]MDW8013442.1 hypothetical protein [Archaeoglobaceae archaeon]